MTRYITRQQVDEMIQDAIREHELATAGRPHRATYQLVAFLDDFGIWEPVRLPVSTGVAGGIVAGIGLMLGLDLETAGRIVLWFTAAGAAGLAASEIAPVLAGPLTRAFDYVADRLQASGGREIPFNDRGKVRMVSMPDEPVRPEYATIRIPSSTLKDGWRDVNAEKLCMFLKSASATGLWQKRKQTTYKPDEWADIRRWILEKYPDVWGKTPPTRFLYAALPKIRARATNQTNQPSTNRSTNTFTVVGRLSDNVLLAANEQQLANNDSHITTEKVK